MILKNTKSLLLLMLSLILLTLPFVACADTVTIDLETATLEELQTAQQQIAGQIKAVQAADAPEQGDALVLTGTGTAIKIDVVIETVPARITVEGKVSVKLTGKYDHSFNYSKSSLDVGVLREANTFSALVEGDGDWTVTIEPLKDGGEMTVSGVGPYVSDFFPLDSPVIVAVSVDASKMDSMMTNVMLGLGFQNKYDMLTSDSLTNELLTTTKGKDTFAADVIANPQEGASNFYWVLNVSPGVEWSITVK